MGGVMHTPGPWSTFSDYDLSLSGESAEGEPIHSWVCVGNPDCSNGEVAIVMGWDASFQDDEMDANIALIAAAPDLRASIDPDVLEFAADCLERLQAGLRVVERLRLQAAEQRAAIAKAEPRS